MKKFYIYIFFLLLCFLNIKNVRAVYCQYDYNMDGDGWKVSWYLTYDSSDNYLSIGTNGNDEYLHFLFDFFVGDIGEKTYDKKVEALIKKLGGNCPDSATVIVGDADGTHKFYGLLLDSQYEIEAIKVTDEYENVDADNIEGFTFLNTLGRKFWFRGKKKFEWFKWVFTDNEHWKIHLNKGESKCIGGECPKFYFSECTTYNELLNDLTENHLNCKDNNNITACENYNTKKTEITYFCLNSLKNGYHDSSCVRPCLNFQMEISDLEGDDPVSNCGFGNKLGNFFANIFKWVKYIAPVLVIILTLVEFIKAIASQNDDEIKKVQGKFVKRLIFAGLLFLLPFIIIFILERFNLVTDNPYCGMI